MNLYDLTIQEATDGLKKKSFSCVELVESCLARVKKIDGKINALLTVDEEGALRTAKERDETVKKDKSVFEKQPLLGIPIVLKDLYTTEGLRTTAGSHIIDTYVPPFDATVVGKYRRAGVIIFAKANEDAWGHGSSGENSDHGATRNPYDLGRVPGGSSSGSAAALAAGECLASTGTDTGSSVRLPAAFCNLVGLKPTYGRVSRYGIIAMASSFDTVGHMTRTVYDNAKVLEVTAGLDPYDATTLPAPVPRYTQKLTKSPGKIKIGVPKEYFISGVDPKIEKLTKEALTVLERLDMEIKEVSLPHTDYAMSCYYILIPSEVSSNLARFDGVRYGSERTSFGPEAKRRIMLGTYTLSSGYYDAYYRKAAKVRRLIKEDFENAFKDVDVLVVPSSPTLPFRLGEKTKNPLSMYLSDIFMCPINLAGVPSLNIPCGFIDNLPVGLQLVGPQLSEERLFQVGHAFEQETQYYKTRPRL